MSRIRTIKPEFFKHDELFEAEKKFKLPLRLAFIGLLTCCDREGRFRWKPRQLKLDVLPYDEVDFEAILNALVSAGFIVKYEVDGQCYGCFPSWHKHQFINHRESESTLPPVNDACITRESPVNDENVTRHGLARGEGEKEGKGKEGKRKRKGKGYSASQRDEDHASTTQNEIVMEIPLNSGEVFQVDNSQAESWCELYPGIDVRQELRNIRGWNLANPTKRKTKSGILKHVNNWLSRAQNRAGKAYSTRSPPSLYAHNILATDAWLHESNHKIFEGEVENES